MLYPSNVLPNRVTNSILLQLAYGMLKSRGLGTDMRSDEPA